MSQKVDEALKMSSDSGQGDSICTPKRVQKCLFNNSSTTVSSSKRNLFQAISARTNESGLSGDDSDLGPMSPLNATDNSSNYDSSPGRQYDSPFTTPENSPRSSTVNWDRLRRPMSRESSRLSPFKSLRKLTRDARASPGRRIFNHSPKSQPQTPQRQKRGVIIPSTPDEKDEVMSDRYVPETPQKDSITDTPKRGKYTEKRLITPLGSVCKSIIVPPIHRRKSLSSLDNRETSSPERNSKRHAPELIVSAGAKFIKTSEVSTISKARASLFQGDNKNDSNQLNFTLSTKSFYNSNFDDNTRHSICFGWKKTVTEPSIKKKKRQSLPSQSYHRRRSSSGPKKKSKNSGINAGVMHRIPRPKRGQSASKADGSKSKKSSPVVVAKPTPSPPSTVQTNTHTTNLKENEPKIANAISQKFVKTIETRPPTPPQDPNKRFFKTNRTAYNIATVTVNENIKLKVSDGKIALKEENRLKNFNKKRKLDVDQLTFDTTDLTVDEPGFNTSVEQNEMADILKVLEDDWGNDEYDEMETLINRTHIRSPLKPITTSNVLMSPASVLSNMTFSMNIDDQPGTSGVENQAQVEPKLFPLFNKGFQQNIFEDLSENKPARGVKRGAWQLSAKMSGDEKQYQIDAGQKRFGATHCLDCGVVYQMGEPEDENAHLIFHNSTKTLKFNGWKKEHVVMEDPFTASRIITIEQSDSKHCWKKIEEVLAVVDRDLGLADMELTEYQNKKIYLYIREKTILGVLVAEHIKEAHRMLPDLVELDCCSTESTPAKCGINVIWTAMSHRRQRIASKLIDTLRAHFYYGYILSQDDIAFSMPTPAGKIFAEKYMGNRNFKVYN